MALVCPAVLASTEKDYQAQLHKVVPFAHRVQIDLTDGQFATSQTVHANEVTWPAGVLADIHLMYKNPNEPLEHLLAHQPNMIIMHAEAEGQFDQLLQACRAAGVKVGLALLKNTPASAVQTVLEQIDHVLVFSGDLGHYGGHADLSQLDKVRELKAMRSDVEIGWDGGINPQNVAQLSMGGVDVLDVGGYIQNSDDAAKAFAELQRIADEAGTT